MSHILRWKSLTGAAALVTASVCAAGPNPRLFKDINTQPAANDGVRFSAVAISDSMAVFTGVDDEHGTELWITDGTPGGTRMLVDIRAGAADSRPEDLVRVGSRVYFTADDGVHGRELWVTDGSAQGTHLVMDLEPGPPGSFIQEMVATSDTLYFVASTSGSVGELWKSDGTPGGTVKVSATGVTVPESVFELAAFGDAVWFRSGSALWRYSAATGAVAVPALVFPFLPPTNIGFLPDGRAVFAGPLTSNATYVSDASAANTLKLVPDGSVTPPALASDLTSLGPWVIFAASSTDRELWRTDGTPAGTMLVKDIATGTGASGSSAPSGFAVLGGFAYFAAYTPDAGVELWRTDGTTDGTTLVMDFWPGMTAGQPNSSNPGNLFAVDGPSPALFLAAESDLGRELWRFDPVTNTAALVKDIAPGPGGSNPRPTCVVGGQLLFTATDGVNGYALFATPVSGGDVTCLTQENAGTLGSRPSSLIVYNNAMYFAASDGTGGNQLWMSDGSAAGTRRISNPGPNGQGLTPSDIAGFGNDVFFAGWSPTTGIELFRSDGTAGGTSLVQDLDAGTASSQPTYFTTAGGHVFFMTDVASGNPNLYGLLNPAASPVLLAGTTSTSHLLALPPWRIGNRVLFLDSTSSLWASDGTPAGTGPIPPGGNGAQVTVFGFVGVFMNSSLIYGFTQAGPGVLLTDGTQAGTTALATLPGGFSIPGGTGMVQTSDGSTGYFVATDGVANVDLWKTDGTPGGTGRVAGLFSGARVTQPVFGGQKGAAIGSLIVFANDDGGPSGSELWVSDGTSGGTHLLLDINPGTAGSNPDAFIAAGGNVYFVATDSIAGRELWVTDGTALGTHRVADINPGTDSSSPTNLTVFSNRLFFAATEPRHGRELWVLPLCAGDFNADGVRDTRDVFDFISAWFARSPLADFNQSGEVTVQDIFDFTAAWLAGCH